MSTDQLPAPARNTVLQSLPRRRGIDVRAVEEEPEQILLSNAVAPSKLLSLQRGVMVWGRAAATFVVRNAVGTLITGRRSFSDRARRLYDVLDKAGGHPQRIGRLIARRLEVLPYQHCELLSGLRDDVAPIELETALDLIEQNLGCSLGEVFQAFDPEPLSSTTVGCRYRAVLLDGRPVSVKVRRPRAVELYGADRDAIRWVLFAVEGLTVVRAEFSELVMDEARLLIEGELDFRLSARHQRLFREFSARARVKGVTATPVLQPLCGPDVLVTEWVEGVPLGVIIHAVQSGDRQMLAKLRAMDIEPKRLARRLLYSSWWAAHEGVVFHQPDADHIVVRPGNELVFTDVLEAQGASARVRRLHREMMRRLLKQDVSGAVEAIVQILTPLPYIDVHTFSRKLEARLSRVLLAVVDPEAPWYERTTAGLWVAVLEQCRLFGVPVRTETSRLITSTVEHQVLAASVWPELDLFDTYQRYERRAAKRNARRMMEEADEAQERGLAVSAMAQMAEISDRVERITFFVDAVTATAPIQHVTLTGKAAYVISTALSLLTMCMGLALGLAAGVVVTALASGQPMNFPAALQTVILHPLFVVACTLSGFLWLRRVQYRLLDTESDG